MRLTHLIYGFWNFRASIVLSACKYTGRKILTASTERRYWMCSPRALSVRIVFIWDRCLDQGVFSVNAWALLCRWVCDALIACWIAVGRLRQSGMSSLGTCGMRNCWWQPSGFNGILPLSQLHRGIFLSWSVLLSVHHAYIANAHTCFVGSFIPVVHVVFFALTFRMLRNLVIESDVVVCLLRNNQSFRRVRFR